MNIRFAGRVASRERGDVEDEMTCRTQA